MMHHSYKELEYKLRASPSAFDYSLVAIKATGPLCP